MTHHMCFISTCTHWPSGQTGQTGSHSSIFKIFGSPHMVYIGCMFDPKTGSFANHNPCSCFYYSWLSIFSLQPLLPASFLFYLPLLLQGGPSYSVAANQASAASCHTCLHFSTSVKYNSKCCFMFF